jgi:hypothetical protein
MQEVKKEKQEKNPTDNQAINNIENDEMPMMGQDDDNNEKLSNNKDEKKFKLSIAALMFLFPLVMIADLVDSLSVTGIGVPIVWVVSGTVTGIVVIWLMCVGMRSDWVLAANLIDLIPILSIFPIKTACLIFVVLSERSEKFQKVVGVAKKTLEIKNKEKVINLPSKESIEDKIA